MSNAVYDTTTDWGKRIAAAKRNGEFTADDRMRASCWATCAIGERMQEANLIPKLGRKLKSVLSKVVFADYSDSVASWFYDHDFAADDIALHGAWKDDHKAQVLGYDFMHAVNRNRVNDAEEVYAKIQNYRISGKSNGRGKAA
jgi:hypothetical protein